MAKKIRQARRGRPKKTPVIVATATDKQPSQKWFRWGESYSSFLMGVIVVIIAVLFVGSFAKLRHTQQISSTSTVNTTAVEKALDETQQQDAKISNPSQKEYTVQEGDDLWTIAVKEYNNGYNWTDIAKANNLDNPDVISAGQKLVIPTATPTPSVQMQAAVATPTPTPAITNDNAIKDNTYTVQAGDSLWNIAVRAYADGYRWTDIAKANNLSEPGLIFSGNVLKLPR